MPFPWQAISTGKTAGMIDERFGGTAATKAKPITWHWEEVLPAEELDEVRATMPIIWPCSGAPGTGKQWNFLEEVAPPASGRLLRIFSWPLFSQQTSWGQEPYALVTYPEASEELRAQIEELYAQITDCVFYIHFKDLHAEYRKIACVWKCEQRGDDFGIVRTLRIPDSSGEPVAKQEDTRFRSMEKPQRKPKLPFLKLLRHQMDEYHFAVPSVFFGGMCGVAACTVFSLGMPAVGFLVGSLCVSVVTAWALATDAKRTGDR